MPSIIVCNCRRTSAMIGIAQLVALALGAHRDCLAYLDYRMKRLVNGMTGR